MTTLTRGQFLSRLLSQRRHSFNLALLPQYKDEFDCDPAFNFWSELRDWMLDFGFGTLELPADQDWVNLLKKVSRNNDDPNDALHLMQVAMWD